MIFRKLAGKPALAFFAGIVCLMGIGMGSVSCDVLDNPAVEVEENAREAVSCVVSFNASFDEIYTKDETTGGTKSSTESCLRLKWNEGDRILAYTKASGAWTYAGALQVTETGYTAKVSGELTIVPDGDLYLVHAPYVEKTPEISEDGSITIDMSSQAGGNMIVAYGKIENVTVDGGNATVDEKVVFTFANSFIRINCCDLPYKDGDNIITFVRGMMSHTNTKIGIKFGDEVTITGSDEGDISIDFSSLNDTYTEGKAVTWAYVPPIILDYDRSVYVDYMTKSSNELHEYKAEKVAKSKHGAGELINTIAQFEKVDVVTGMSIVHEKIDGNLTPGKTLQLSFNYTGNYLYEDSLVWTSSDTTVGTIDQNGLFTALKAGETKITVRGKYTYIEDFICTTDVEVVAE